MKKFFALAATTLALSATVASAQNLPGGSINLAWGDCYFGGAGGTVDQAFACNLNTGAAFTLFASVVPPTGLTQFVGTAAVIDFQSAASPMPLWWQYGGCRLSTSLTAAPAAGVTSCPDLTNNPQFGGIDYAYGFGGLNRARLRTAYAIDAGLAGPVSDAAELTVLQLTINKNRTTGTGSCAGCLTPVCIVFNSLLLDQVNPALPKGVVTSGPQQFATWQGGGSCPGSTPTQSRTWGQVKSLYR